MNIMLPSEWRKNQVTFHWNGNYIDVNATTSGAWTKFTFPDTLQGDVNNNIFWFSYVASAGNPNSGQNSWIGNGNTGWNTSVFAPSNTSAFSCANFGSSRELYILPANLTNPNVTRGATLVSNQPISAKVFYFYPPNTTDWIAGKSYVYDSQSAKLMGVDPNKCGWYRVVYFDEDPSAHIQIWLGQSGTDRIGSEGKLSDLYDAKLLGSIALADKFAQLGDTIYFVADDIEPGNPNSGWYDTDPGIENMSRCTFNLAAYIYDTDASVHPDFSCGEYYHNVIEGNGPSTYANCQTPGFTDAYTPGGNLKPNCLGVQKNVVKPTLNPVTKKIEYNAAGDQISKCWTNEEWFNKAFTSTPGVNVQTSFNLPFTINANGFFEFDSDTWKNASGNLVGGFFLPDNYDTTADYSQCPNCNAKRNAELFFLLAIDKDVYDSYQSMQGDFNDVNTPSSIGGQTSSGKDGIWDWSGTRDKLDWYLHGDTAIKGDAKGLANQHFCFESHTSFIYDPAQEFYFTGSSAIWVYINGQLVIDLGGNHAPAPAHVKLREMYLQEGYEYPIDIFFCNMRTAYSTIRISTNMYIQQKSLFTANPKLQNSINEFCAGNVNAIYCGKELVEQPNYKLEFFMLRRGSNRDTIWLDPNKMQEGKNECAGEENNFTCYGIIKIENGTYSCGREIQCKGNQGALNIINNNFNVYVRLFEGDVQVGKALEIDRFQDEISVRNIYSGKVPCLGNGSFCGIDLINLNYQLEFYMLRQDSKDTIWLDPNKMQEGENECTGEENNFTCYGGIKIENGTYSCGREIECRYDIASLNFIGSAAVWVRILKNGLEINAGLVDFFTKEESTRIARILSAFNIQEPKYYNLKGEPLGSKKPSKAGVYIVRQNGTSIKIVVR